MALDTNDEWLLHSQENGTVSNWNQTVVHHTLEALKDWVSITTGNTLKRNSPCVDTISTELEIEVRILEIERLIWENQIDRAISEYHDLKKSIILSFVHRVWLDYDWVYQMRLSTTIFSKLFISSENNYHTFDTNFDHIWAYYVNIRSSFNVRSPEAWILSISPRLTPEEFCRAIDKLNF